MLYTVTLNPCLDRHLVVEQLNHDDANRILLETRYAAGKGIDVSRVIAELDEATVALGFVGGFSGQELEGRLINNHVQCSFTRISGETRTNIHIFDRSNRRQTSLNAPGPEVQPAELGMFCDRIRDLTPRPTLAALCGSVPRGVTREIYAQLGVWLREQGARVILDADGHSFRTGLKCGPYLIKPNIHELSRFLNEDLEDVGIEVLIKKARVFFDYGVEVIALSMGGRGLLLMPRDAGSAWHVTSPPIKVDSTIGAGDSLIAGMMVGLHRGQTLVQAARLGVACGSATAMSPGTALCKKETVQELLPDVQVKQLPV